MAETTYHWHNDADHFTREDDIRQQFSSLMSDQFDPQQMIDAMVDLIGADHGKFRNVVPESVEALIKTTQSEAWTRSI